MVKADGYMPEILEAFRHVLDDIGVPVEVEGKAFLPALVGVPGRCSAGARLLGSATAGASDGLRPASFVAECQAVSMYRPEVDHSPPRKAIFRRQGMEDIFL